jgi:predicted membrane protein
LIVCLGLLWTGDNLNWWDAGRVMRFWPLALVVVGATLAVQPEDRGRRIFGLILIGLGLWMSFAALFDFELAFWEAWPLIIVALGVRMIMRSTQRVPTSPSVPLPESMASDQRFSDFAFWSGVKRRVASSAFRQADLTAIMGGIELDLSGASTGGGTAVIDVFAMWGGIEIKVPPDWTVSNQVFAIMGGAEDGSTGPQDSTNRLILRGVVLMGGIEVKT